MHVVLLKFQEGRKILLEILCNVIQRLVGHEQTYLNRRAHKILMHQNSTYAHL